MMPTNTWGQPQINQQPSPASSMVVFTNANDDNPPIDYPVNPGMTVALINANDPENGRMYIKSSEQNGCPNPMRVFEIKEITPQKQSDGNFVSRTEFENMSKQMQEMKNLMMAFCQQAQTKEEKAK